MLCGFSIDAAECSRLGKYVNDAPRRVANCYSKVVAFDGMPHVLIIAGRDIGTGEELRYDYGVADAPWRNRNPVNFCMSSPNLAVE